MTPRAERNSRSAGGRSGSAPWPLSVGQGPRDRTCSLSRGLDRARFLILLLLPVFAGAAANEELRKAARRHWDEGLRHFQEGDRAKAREAWSLCRQLDPANSDCAAGVKRIDDEREAAREKAAAKVKKAKPAPRQGAKLKTVTSFGAPRSIPGQGNPEGARYWNAGIAHFQKGDTEGARRAWAECLKRDPGNKDCRTGLARLEGKP